MKRLMTFFLALCFMLAICACGSKEGSTVSDAQPKENSTASGAQATEDHQDGNDHEAYFQIIDKTTTDQFGEPTGKYRYIMATVVSKNTKGEPSDQVNIYYNGGASFPKDDYYFCFKPYGGWTVNRIDYKIDNEASYIVPAFKNFICKGTEAETYAYLESQLMEGKDITFSLRHGENIFTLHGKGFADLVKELENSDN